MPINKPWQQFDPDSVKSLPGNLGVYELGDENGNVIYIGYAGGKSLFGLQGEIAKHFLASDGSPAARGQARYFRYEVNQMYITRWTELLILYREEHGSLPPGNEAPGAQRPQHLGRFHWQPSTGAWQQ